MSTPRIRPDLNATPTEEQGVKYFDVSDPKSGARMRLYDFEWLIAERMDGRRPYDEVASWARERLGIHPSPSDLENFASKLRELGFFELDGEPQRATPDARTMMGEAPSSNNGAGAKATAAAAAEEFEAVPSLVAESPLLGREADSEPDAPDAHDEPEPSPPVRALTPVSGPTPVKEPEPKALPPAPLPQVNAPRVHEEMTTGAVARAEPKAASKSSAGSLLILFLVLLVVAAIVAYIKFMGGSTAKVATVVATPREVVRLYDASATVRRSEGQTLSFGEAGKVSDVVAAGTEAKAGMPLATLESYAKIEKELADVKDRASFYEKQLATAKAKNDAEATKNAEGKVAEKRKLMNDLEARAAKVRLVAPGAGTVAQVMAQAGSDAKPGEPVLKLADKHAIADFKLGAGDAAALKSGATASLQPALGGAPLSGRVSKIDGDTVTVELPEDAPVKPGDAVRLVKQRVPNVVPVPATALTHRETGDVVYVLADGAVHERSVSVVDRSGNEALIGSGLSGGDVVVAAGADNLHDGQKATQ
jgi:RND family efflux transporter MFP subunit